MPELKIIVGNPEVQQDVAVVHSGKLINIHTCEMEKHKVPCPYPGCVLGYVLIDVKRMMGGGKVTGLKHPHRCNTCRRWVKVLMHFKLEGVPFSSQEDLTKQRLIKEFKDGGG